ncbi:hypothetical protein LTR36_008569 [Oleoguttula mirabilis]|uniref:F-box protein n=1 Tax=Oleoguttula mirabilis TaxID=1507867 RepID=A0AAV9JUS0_9PEZI|nr:hypothetical protein LTR36_008569 [Oleoguttula mirabilis]
MEAQDKPPQKRKKRSGKNRRKKCKSAEQEDPLPLPPKASLLGLPGELQNKIFRFVLLEPDRIYVDASHHDQPSLLRTCRKIQEEALPIFYKENKFAALVVDLYYSVPRHHWINSVGGSPAMYHLGTLNWCNLLAWVKRYYECEAPGMDNFDFTSSPGPGILHRDDRHMVVSRVFRIADVFLKYKVAWEAVEEALEEFRVAVAYKDSSWSWT